MVLPIQTVALEPTFCWWQKSPVLIVAHCLRTEAYGASEINGAESLRQPSILFFKYSVKLSAHLKRDRSTRAGSPCLRGAAGDRKGLVKIPRIFLAQTRFTTLAHVLDKSALYGRGISPQGERARKLQALHYCYSS